VAASANEKGAAPMSLAKIGMLQQLMYRLVQSSHSFWHKQLKTMMDKLKLDLSTEDYCLYYKWIGDKNPTDIATGNTDHSTFEQHGVC
jgi:hypothetical protein